MSTFPYREVPPPRALRDRVECFWVVERRLEPGSAPHVQRVVASDRTNVIFKLDDRGSRLYVVGPASRFALVPMEATALTIGVRLLPGAAPLVLGAPASEFADGRASLEDVWSGRGRELHERLALARAAEDRVKLLADELARRSGRALDPRIEATVARLRAGRGADLDALARDLGLGARQLRRVLAAWVGLNPKLVARLARLRAVLADSRFGTAPWVVLALDHGYYDQAHMIRDFEELAGTSPGRMSVSSNTGSRRSATLPRER
ncbi:helix-turn-helix domain-containing protein [bacterium]|nr:helix-turn-helix domain-containing protein [bacterium]